VDALQRRAGALLVIEQRVVEIEQDATQHRARCGGRSIPA
jgi:hypothetical protein